MRLIDADALKAEFTEDSPVLWHYTGIWAVIDNAPTIDVIHLYKMWQEEDRDLHRAK